MTDIYADIVLLGIGILLMGVFFIGAASAFVVSIKAEDFHGAAIAFVPALINAILGGYMVVMLMERLSWLS